MQSGTIALMLGVLLLQQHADLPNPTWVLILPFFFLLWRYRKSLQFPFFVLVGYCWALLYAYWTLSHFIPENLEGHDLQITGEVISIPESKNPDYISLGSNNEIERPRKNLNFLFQIDTVAHNNNPATGFNLPLKVRLGWYATNRTVKAGDQWQLIVRLKQPNGFMNPGGFDYEGWLFQRGIRATGYVRTDDHNKRLASKSCIICFSKWRQDLSDHLDGLLINNDQKGVIKALITGERAGISSEQWKVLAQTGTNHLLAISGLHIGLVAGLVYWLMRRIWSLSYLCTLYLPAQKAAASSAILAAFTYAALAGFSIPTRRAFIMVAVAMIGVLLGRATSPSHLLALALMIVLLIDPTSVLSVGFWLSFTAVATILYGMSARVCASGNWWKWGRVQWLVFIGLFPLTLICFQRLSLISPIANLITVPIVSLLVVPSVLVATVFSLLDESIATLLFLLVQYQLEVVWVILGSLGSMPFSLWEQGIASTWVMLSAIIGVVLLLAPSGFPRKLGFIFIFPLLLLRPEAPEDGEIWLTVLDVGQGLSIVVQTRNHTMLYDTGPRYSRNFDTGKAVVVPFMKYSGIKYLDTVMVSHANLDHTGGLRSVLKAVPVGYILTGEPLPMREVFLEDDIEGSHHRHMERNAENYGYCLEARSWVWDKVTFEILHPSPGYDGNHNNHSCVIKISTKNGSILLTGDIDKQVEKHLVQKYGDKLLSDILVAPHHGSNTSSSTLFISGVRPEHAIFSSGYRNRFGHPKEQVLERYRKHGVIMASNSAHGAVQYRIHPADGISGPKTHRFAARHYWNRTISQKSPFYPTVQ